MPMNTAPRVLSRGNRLGMVNRVKGKYVQGDRPGDLLQFVLAFWVPLTLSGAQKGSMMVVNQRVRAGQIDGCPASDEPWYPRTRSLWERYIGEVSSLGGRPRSYFGICSSKKLEGICKISHQRLAIESSTWVDSLGIGSVPQGYSGYAKENIAESPIALEPSA